MQLFLCSWTLPIRFAVTGIAVRSGASMGVRGKGTQPPAQSNLTLTSPRPLIS